MEELLPPHCAPFVQSKTSPSIYEWRVRYTRVYIAFIGTCASLLAFIFWDSSILWLSIFLISLRILLRYHKDRKYVINQMKQSLSFWIGNTCVNQQPFYNIYIRLQKRIDLRRNTYYVILGGCGIETQIISKNHQSKYKQRQWGQQLAHCLHLNYFDVRNVSKHHCILHLPTL